jgi:hypothetical protein
MKFNSFFFLFILHPVQVAEGGGAGATVAGRKLPDSSGWPMVLDEV